MKKYFLFMGLLFLSACSTENMQISNPFSSTTDVQSVYISQFPDVPIPIDMNSDPKLTTTTISSSGQKIGRETLKGRVEHNSLGAAMAHNLSNQGWTMLGIVQGQATLQIYSKDSRYLVVSIEDGSFSTTLSLWMMSRIGGQSSLFEQVQEVFSMDSKPQDPYGKNPLSASAVITRNPVQPSSQNNNPIQIAKEQAQVQSHALQEVSVQNTQAPKQTQAAINNEKITEPNPFPMNESNNNFDTFGSNSLFE